MIEKSEPKPEVEEAPSQGFLDLLNLEPPAKDEPPPQDEPDQVVFVEDNELSKSGRRELEIMVHCATNIYKVGTKDPPCAFVSLKSLVDHEADVVAQSSTSVAEESLAPDWGEILRIYFSASQEVKAVLKIIDFDEGHTLRTFQIETSQFKLGVFIFT